ncbi:uncharacterized protein LOC143891068 [Tasmannia lanceolata]|uniref:uncharacterized protein LOC143891068 n=1 Tax=Tasmannia lanceolata TaxID=3420 RepID=UPI0040632680
MDLVAEEDDVSFTPEDIGWENLKAPTIVAGANDDTPLGEDVPLTDADGGGEDEDIEYDNPGDYSNHQEAPLSPFLFVIVAETLSRLLEKGKECGLIEGFKIEHLVTEISHLQFVDNTFLFSTPYVLKLMNLRAMIRYYEMVIKQRTNFHKSKIFGIHVDAEATQGLAGILGCKVDHLPSNLPLGVGTPKKVNWDPTVESVVRTLHIWKRNLVSRDGRLTLIKAVLANILIYQGSLFKCPASVKQRIEQIQRRFLWGGSEWKKKVSH